MSDKELLKKIVTEYDSILTDSRLFKSIVSDFFSNNRVVKNLLCASYEEKIPHAISQMKHYSKMDEGRFVKRLVDAYACKEDKAKEIISLWAYAYNVDFVSDLLSTMNNMINSLYELSDLTELTKSYPIEVLELGSKIEKLLHSNNIDTIRDILCVSEEELKSIKGIGEKTSQRIIKKLYEYDQFKLSKNVDDHFTRFYPVKLRNLTDSKRKNWEWIFYINAMLDVYTWIDKFKETYQVYAFNSIVDDLNDNLGDELSKQINDIRDVINIFNENCAEYTFIDKTDISLIITYIDNMYRFYKSVVICEARVKVSEMHAFIKDIYIPFLDFYKEIYQSIEKHRKILIDYKSKKSEDYTSNDIDNLPLRVSVDYNIFNNINSQIMDYLSKVESGEYI